MSGRAAPAAGNRGMRVHPGLRVSFHAGICAAVLLLAACMICADGVYLYVVEGRLLLDDGSPVNGILVSLDSPDGFWGEATPLDGYFSVTCLGGMFGGCALFPCLLDSPGPPPMVHEIRFIAEVPWDAYETTMAVPEEMQRRFERQTRWVLLGDVTLVAVPIQSHQRRPR